MHPSYDQSIADALADVLPAQFRQDIPVLAQVLTAARDGAKASVVTTTLREALMALQGRTLQTQGDSITVGNISGEGIAIGHGAQATVIRIYVPRTAEEERAWRNRSHMLEKVRNYWIEGFLRQSLHKIALIDLEMRYALDALDSPWEMLVQSPDRPRELVPLGSTIADVFDTFGGEMLILGAPGSGKTTMLLELVRSLIERAQQDETHPLPVVFHLSSWAAQHSPLFDWLVEELRVRYQISHKVAAAWLGNNQLLPLLDGLDEVQREHRDACVEAINMFHETYGPTKLLVCSRIADYTMLTTKLRLQGAIMLQTLTEQQIEASLQQLGPQSAIARSVLRQLQDSAQRHNDVAAQELMRTPLILSIALLAYQGASDSPMPPADVAPAEQQRHLFATYVERMLERRGRHAMYTPEQTKHWLIWLAARMVEQGQTIFYLEKLQPEGTLSRLQQRQFDQIAGTLRGILIGIAVGSFASILIALLAFVWKGFGATIGLRGALAFTLGSIGLFSLFYAMVGFVAASKPGVERIHLIEELSWTHKNMIRALRYGIGAGILGVLVGIVRYGWLGIIPGLATGVALWALILGKEISTGESSPEVRVRPNQGIWTSAGNALKLSLIAAISLGLSIGFNLSIDQEPVFAALIGTCVGIGVGVFAALFYGAETYLKHFLLRFILYRQGHIPRDYSAFLDYAAERILLRKVGGGYIFVHRTLLEYFADLEEDAQPRH